jgi:thioredoxin-like negative regulator of GroEL
VYTYNVDTDRNFTQEFNVRSVPTVKLFDGGKVVNSGSGVMNINQLQSFVS